MTINNNTQRPSDSQTLPFKLICNAPHYFPTGFPCEPQPLPVEHICSTTYYFDVDFPNLPMSAFEVLAVAQREIDELKIDATIELGYYSSAETAVIHVNASTVGAMVAAYRAVDHLARKVVEDEACLRASASLE